MSMTPGQDTAFCDDLWTSTLHAVVSGRRTLLFWGFNEVCIELLSRLNARGLGDLVSGVVDTATHLQGTKIGPFTVLSPHLIPSLQVDTLVVTLNEEKEEALRGFASLDVRMPLVVIAGAKHLEFRDAVFRELLSSCMVSSRAWGYQHMLVHIYQSLVYIADRQLKGDVAEFGVYKAGTTVFIARTVKKLGLDARVFAFDTFTGFPGRRSLFDLYSDPHDEFVDFTSVENYCRPFNIELVRGDICETYGRIEEVPLVLSFFDTDNYTPTRAALEMCYERTVPGGILAFDHYQCDSRWLYTLGERMAINEVMKDKHAFNLHGTGIFVKL